MADEKTCPHCGKPVPPTALGDLCPECMLKAGLATQTEGPGGTGPHGTKVVHPPPTPAEIAALFPQLEILECLGRGGMGVVYKARQPRLNRFVALKILAREKEQDAQFAERFTREAQALARLNHPNIVTVHDFGEAGGHCYLVMEFVDGLNLRQLLQARKMPSEQALAIVPKICEALQYAHEQGVVHRDIKPENILLDKSGRVKIADFGIAKMLGDETGQQTLTGARDAVGTPHYMAPEQIEKPLSVDHRADIYSLGVVFYEMLTGELPLGRFAPPSKKVQIDVRLDEVVLHALEKEPDRRYQQASQIKTAVETITAASEPGAGRRTAIKTEPAGSQNRLTPAATAFRRGAHVGLWVFLLIVFTASLITFLLPTTYLGTARVELTGLAPQSGDPYYVQTEFQVIESDSVLEGVVDSLELDQRWGKQFNGGTPLNNAEVMALMRSRIDLRPIRNTDVIEIGFFSSSPKEAAEIANKIAETYCALPPGHRGAIIERAAAPFHPIRPNVPLNIFLGIVAGSVAGIFVGLGFGLFSFWRLRAAQFEALPPAQKPDRFWRRFAIAVAAVLFALILIPIFVVLLAMFLPALNASRDRIQAIRIQNAAQQNVMTNFYIGQTWFPRGDSIEITSVERTKNQMTVKGHYNLVSHDNALLALYVTTMDKIAVPVGPDERMQINKGNG
ncbi:MAG TPA: protein kinase, partial [Verrucomicrobiae bacterium]|nr:protein kinase [Verrucomicrobiae bacterium]